MVNKGAQSMTFIIMNELRKRYPDDTILLMLPDDTNSVDESLYFLRPITVHIKSVFYLLGGLAKVMAIGKHVDMDDITELTNILQKSRLMVDISGYVLGSNWGDYLVRFYLCVIHLAYKYHIPICVMPQSFGPFDYKFPKSVTSNWYIRKVMQYPEVIYAREQEGCELLIHKYHLTNVEKTCDMVLMSGKVDPKLIYRKAWIPQKIDVEDNAIGIILNVRLLNKISKATLFSLYLSVGKKLRESGKKIYVIHHSGEDRELADDLYRFLSANSLQVARVSNDMNCIEYEDEIKKFDFIIASRYHSLVHAYKAGIPCIAVGWAIKYQELLAELGQDSFAFDISSVDENSLIQGVSRMLESFESQRDVIQRNVKRIQANDIYRCLDNRS